ncbi:MAG: hypothetical protein ABF289_15995 [Clostridiales bacterium]
MDWNIVLLLIEEKKKSLNESVTVEYEACKIDIKSNIWSQINNIKNILGILFSNKFICEKKCCNVYSFDDITLWNYLERSIQDYYKGEEVFLHETSKYIKYEFHDRALLMECNKKSFILCLYNNNSFFYVKKSEKDFESKDTVRILRHIIHNSFIGAGGITIHAAAAETNNVGVCIVGPSGCSKTTIFLNCIYKNNAKIMANDNVILFNDNKKIYICGTSFSVNIFPEVLNGFTLLKEYVLDKYSKNEVIKNFINYNYKSNFESNKKILPLSGMTHYVNEKISISMFELSLVMNTSVVKTSELNLILLPEFNFKNIDNSLEIASYEDVFKKLENALLPPSISYYDNWTRLGMISEDLYKRRVDLILEKLLNDKIKGFFIKGNRFMYNFNEWEQLFKNIGTSKK